MSLDLPVGEFEPPRFHVCMKEMEQQPSWDSFDEIGVVDEDAVVESEIANRDSLVGLGSLRTRVLLHCAPVALSPFDLHKPERCRQLSGNQREGVFILSRERKTGIGLGEKNATQLSPGDHLVASSRQGVSLLGSRPCGHRDWIGRRPSRDGESHLRADADLVITTARQPPPRQRTVW